MTWAVHCADVLDWCAKYEGEKFHACLCDPPYELAFMGKSWDNSGVAFQPATWAAIAEHLHPGGFILAFGGSRTYHRLAVAAEDAGLIVHPAIVHLQGQGFPKATRIDTQIDKAAGAEREVVIDNQWLERYPNGPGGNGFHGGVGRSSDGSRDRPQTKTAPATPLAAAWAGHRYGLQALKPCAEFILCAQKPYEGRPVDCITSTGAGALNIDGARVATGECLDGGAYADDKNKSGSIYGKLDYGCGEFKQPPGRWPPNVCLSHLPGCERLGVKRVRGSNFNGHPNGRKNAVYGQDNRSRPALGYADPDGTEAQIAYACVLTCDGCGHQWTAEQRGACPECGGEARWACAAAELGEQSGERPNSARPNLVGKYYESNAQIYGKYNGIEHNSIHNDTGTAARFYPQFTWQHEIAERLAGVTPFRYVSKASRAQRDAGLEGFERQANDFQRETSGLNQDRPNREGRKPAIPPRNPHPTVKNIELTKWLATLILPPPEYAPRRVLIPFGGSGSEAIGAGLAGWDEIVAIEMEEEYCQIAEARLAHWLHCIQMELSL